MTKKKLSKSRTNQSLHGVCGGIGEYFNLSPNLIRLCFVFSPFPFTLMVYIVLANIMPDSPEDL
ncbi:PspC domain-containing protein [Alkalibacterium olivapovliticus]|uniref:PspC domain-containing protein n=1 Tax=Alkalibacterium olivapovliticus TaxID=99907 RepID=UPI000D050AD8|nr:PspC domain-containing protein [Alkalibacterium olivapovliticus]